MVQIDKLCKLWDIPEEELDQAEKDKLEIQYEVEY